MTLQCASIHGPADLGKTEHKQECLSSRALTRYRITYPRIQCITTRIDIFAVPLHSVPAVVLPPWMRTRHFDLADPIVLPSRPWLESRLR